tara:strand:+ start:2784 stop:3953 length:1170 start_codon:yes stop_codon:yes gene_type:complete
MIVDFTSQIIAEKENKTLNKPFRTPGGPKKFSVYVKNEKGNVVKVNFGDPNMEIKRDDPNRRKNFRARHNCDNPGPKTKARYWSCKMWSKKSVTQMTKGSHPGYDWDGETIFDLDELIEINPALAFVEEEVTEGEDDCGCGDCGCKEVEAKHDMSKYSFNNPGEAMKKAKEMGFDDIHTHGDGDDTVFMPGPNHEALMKKLESKGSLWKNIHNKRERIKKGSGEKMRKKGEKGAPTPEQMKKAKKKKVYAEYDMTLEEYDEVMDFEDAVAARPGRKSGAQTPAKPSERKKGSSKNKPGSAGKGGSAITFSEKVINSLKNKVKEHNSKSKKKVTLGQLKKVYRRGAGAFSQSHRPGMTRGGWAMARVNMFLKMKRGGKVKDSYRKADGDI